METMTMVEFRRDAQRALLRVQRGERLLITYRGKPIARLEPVLPERGAVLDDDPLLRIDDFAVDGPGGRLTNRQMDRFVYER